MFINSNFAYLNNILKWSQPSMHKIALARLVFNFMPQYNQPKVIAMS